MRCLSDRLIDRAAAGCRLPFLAALHLRRCERCRGRREQALADNALLDELRELAAQRAGLSSMATERLEDSSRGAVEPPG